MRPERPAIPARIAIVGEAPGEQEILLGRPFIGAAGLELNQQLKAAGILRSECFLTNVFDIRPENNDVERLCYDKGEERPLGYSLPALRPGKYFRSEIALPALERLRSELSTCGPDGGPPTLVVALGNTALWALCETSGIGKLRGAPLASTLLPGVKVLPTYHPAATLRDYSLGVIAITDFIKARREAEFPDIRRPPRTIYIAETLEDVLTYDYYKGNSLAFDVETSPKRRILLCLGLAPSPREALVIPFVNQLQPDYSYWSAEDEVQIWKKLREVMSSSHPKVGQNGAYDFQWLAAHKVQVRNWRADTMIAHHALYPELPKGLAFLGSVYTDEVAWKTMRPRGQQSRKREE